MILAQQENNLEPNGLKIQNRTKSYRPSKKTSLSYQERPLLGEILTRSGALTLDNLQTALDYQETKGIRLGEALVGLNFITEDCMRKSLCMQLNIPYINLENTTIERSLAKLINKNYAWRHQIVPIARIGDILTLAMNDPVNVLLIEELEAATKLTINVVTSVHKDIVDAFYRLYENMESSEVYSNVELIELESNESFGKSKYLESQQLKKADTLVGQILSIGLDKYASDIHIEAVDHRILIRFRIDGVLQELPLGSLQEELNRLRREIVSRVKILGNLDITERRRPQDGRFQAMARRDGQDFKIDFRISIIPGYYGENVVLRILDNRNAPKSIDHLGFSKKILDRLHSLLKRKTGIILVTGPTGSGKSTTLYGALMELYRPDIKILTAEDPIEYVYDNITQCEINQKIGNTFAAYIRSFLRQDPEVIMVGEIRDQETAEMAFRAAQTGHMVLSTLHTNDAVSSIYRLLDLKVDSNLIASCLSGIVSQRLVRKICPDCKKEYTPSKDLLNEFFDAPPSDIRWFKGQKCSHCNYTGYMGRLAVSELWIPSEEDTILINKGARIDELRESANKSTVFMAEGAIEKLREGRTNLEEMLRTLPYYNINQFRHLGEGSNSIRMLKERKFDRETVTLQ